MVKINPERLKQSLEALADLARTPEGINRLTYTDAFWRSCDYVAEKMREAGMTVKTNAVGNLVGTYEGKSRRKIVMGSHIDSVPNGGMFDGCLGVMAAIEAIHTLHDAGIVPEHSIDVVAWAEEEGVVINGLMGSLAYCGLPLTPIQLEKLGDYNITLEDIQACRVQEPVDYSLELHIEQGGVLDQAKQDIGVVTAIVAIKRFQVTVDGIANHAGSTPMTLRSDALVRACDIIKRMPALVQQVDPEMVGTIGHVVIEPNAVNVVPGRVIMDWEFRAVREESIDTAYERLKEEFKEEIASIHPLMHERAYHMNETVMQAIEAASADLGLSHRRMPSGAGHDTMCLAQITKPGMIFVPSVGGISHSCKEWTEWADVTNGANVLVNALMSLDKTP